MTTPSEPDKPDRHEGVDLGKGDPAGAAPFDPYRFGKPEHPIPAEYAPPGYTGPVTPPPTPYTPPNPWGPPGGGQPNPFSNPPGTPYAEQPSPYHYPAGPPGQYGPPPPPYHGYAQPRTGNGKAITALVMGILSIVFFWTSFLDGIFVIIGLIFAIIAISETKIPGTGGRGMAVTGLICTIVGALLATAFTALIIHAADQCGGVNNNNTPGWNHCIRQNLF